MDIRNKNDEGKTICPNCKKAYWPTLGERKHEHLLIQEEFPDARPIEREQLLTGLCSDACWNAYLGINDSEKDDWA